MSFSDHLSHLFLHFFINLLIIFPSTVFPSTIFPIIIFPIIIFPIIVLIVLFPFRISSLSILLAVVPILLLIIFTITNLHGAGTHILIILAQLSIASLLLAISLLLVTPVLTSLLLAIPVIITIPFIIAIPVIIALLLVFARHQRRQTHHNDVSVGGGFACIRLHGAQMFGALAWVQHKVLFLVERFRRVFILNQLRDVGRLNQLRDIVVGVVG